MSKMIFTLALLLATEALLLATEALLLATEAPTPDDPRFDHVF